MDAGTHRYFDTSSDEFDGASVTELLTHGQIQHCNGDQAICVCTDNYHILIKATDAKGACSQEIMLDLVL